MDSYEMEAPTDAFVYPTKYVHASPEIHKIRDWLLWSIINIFLALGGGLLPLIFSLICRSNKRNHDVIGARTMSSLALAFNILATLGGIFFWIILILQIIIFANNMSTIN